MVVSRNTDDMLGFTIYCRAFMSARQQQPYHTMMKMVRMLYIVQWYKFTRISVVVILTEWGLLIRTSSIQLQRQVLMARSLGLVNRLEEVTVLNAEQNSLTHY